MRGLTGILLLAVTLYVPISLQASDPWADEVVTVSYGPGAGFGQSYFPENVLGPPDSSASAQIPSQSPAELLALGSGGEIVLRCDEPGITDGPGPDFTVFENVFVYGDNLAFTETAFVAISADGVTWHEFPWDAETFDGLAGVTPTHGNADPCDPAVSGGDSFDLADLNLDTVYYVRLTDTDGEVDDAGPSFDLDAVVAMHCLSVEHEPDPVLPHDLVLHAWPNPFNSSITISAHTSSKIIHIFDSLGRTVAVVPIHQGRAVWNAEGVSSGVFLIRVDGLAQPIRVVKVR